VSSFPDALVAATKANYNTGIVATSIPSDQ